MFFDGHSIQGREVEFLFRTLHSKRTKVDGCLNELKSLVKEQCILFPTSQSFDFRTLFKECVDGNELDAFKNSKVLHALGTITQSGYET